MCFICLISVLILSQLVLLSKKITGLLIFFLILAFYILANCSNVNFIDSTLWHFRLDHPAYVKIRTLKSEMNID